MPAPALAIMWAWFVISLLLYNNPVIVAMGMAQGYVFGWFGANLYLLKSPYLLRAAFGELE